MIYFTSPLCVSHLPSTLTSRMIFHSHPATQFLPMAHCVALNSSSSPAKRFSHVFLSFFLLLSVFWRRTRNEKTRNTRKCGKANEKSLFIWIFYSLSLLFCNHSEGSGVGERAPFYVFLSFELRHITCVRENVKNSGFCGVSEFVWHTPLNSFKSLSAIFC